MTWSLHRVKWVLVAVALLGGAAFLEQANARPPRIKPIRPLPGTVAPAVDGAVRDGFENSGLSLPKDEFGFKDKIKAAVDYIEEKDWATAVPHLQKMIDLKQDFTVKVTGKGPDGKETARYASVKSEAYRLIGSLPPAGMAYYKLTFGGQAQEMLNKAKATTNMELLGEIIRRFPFTDAGTEAILLAARHDFDRGNFIGASLRFKKLLEREDLTKQPVERILEMALATPPSEKAVATKLWEALRSRTKEVTLGKLTKSVDEWQDYAASIGGGVVIADASESPLFRGTPGRTNLLVGGPAFLADPWQAPMLFSDKGDATRTRLQQAERLLRMKNQPMLSSFFPVTATATRKDGTPRPLIVYRSHRGVMAADLKTGSLVWYSLSNYSLEGMLVPDKVDGGRSAAINSWLAYFEQIQRPDVVFENSVVGTLSTDNRYVYAIEDFQVPPAQQQVFNPGWPGGMVPGVPGTNADLIAATRKNKLQALSLVREGSVDWEAGEGEKGDLADSFFLGPPLPIGGKIYILNEKQQDLRLVCLDPDAHGKLVSIQTLATTNERVDNDVQRRMSAVHLAYSDGILVVPTNAGAVFGVDLLENRLVWAHPYRKGADVAAAPQPNPGFPGGVVVIGPGGMPRPAVSAIRSGWKESAPAIQDGKVVFTAPDSRHLHCINLLDGSEAWPQPYSRQDDDLYFAGIFRGKVLIVGKKQVRALDLATGNPAWAPLDVGQPSGQGIASENIYYLPLRESNATHEPGIAAIDLDKGTFSLARSRPRSDGGAPIVPGNLLFYQGSVISQSPFEVAGFPQLKVKIAEMDASLAKNPDDPGGLLQRGELRLDQGDRLGAIEDLRKALRNKPDQAVENSARGKLFDAMTEYVQNNFDASEDFLKEYEGLCEINTKNDADTKEKARKRRGTFLFLVAKGREKQGRLVEAFERYQEFAAIGSTDELISVLDEPSVRANADVWARGRITSMLASASEENRKPLEKLIADRWEKVKVADLDQVRHFLRVFGSVSVVGKEARFLLAERLINEGGPDGLLEAERELQTLRMSREAPETAARAVEALARLYTRRGLLEDAAYCYRLLGRDYTSIKVREGKTGGDIFDEAATDKFLRPYMDAVKIAPVSTIRSSHETGGFGFAQQMYHYARQGDMLPYFDRHTVALNFQTSKLTLLDDRAPIDKRERTLQFAGTYMQTMVGQPNAARLRYRTTGHLMIVPDGHMVYGVDPINMKIVWERNLAGSAKIDNPTGQQMLTPRSYAVDPRDGSIQVAYIDWKQRLGQVGAVGGGVVCLHTHDGLEALDPLTGNTLWKRSDVAAATEIFADDEYIYLVDLSDEGAATSGRVFRAVDGVTVLGTPNFAGQYQKRIQVVGRTILMSETGAATGAVTLRVYDILKGKDIWTHEYPAKSVVLQPIDTSLGGVILPDGMVHVIDVATQKDVLKTSKGYDLDDPKTGIDTSALKDVQSVSVLQDGLNIYLACNATIDPNIARFGGVQPNLWPGLGLRATPVNGKFFAYERATGKFRYYLKAENQMLVLEHFEELPILLFSSNYTALLPGGPAGAFRGVSRLATLIAADKRTAKSLVASIPNPEDNGQNLQQFHTLQVNERERNIEFINQNRKFTFHLESGETRVGAAPGDR
jgi:outer membrane protein assembly factor BamB